MGEIQRLLKTYESIGICLQHVNSPIPSIGKYSLAVTSRPEEGNLGTAIYIHHKVFYDKITINQNDFQISAIRVQLDNQKFIICNMYNQPNKNYDLKNLQALLGNFSE